MVTVESLKTSVLFCELEDEAVQRVIPLCREERFDKGTIVFSKGDEAKTLFILQEGKISLEYEICPQPDACQDTRILLDRPGDVMGWSSLVKPRRVTASAYCITDVRVIAIDSKGMNELMEQDSHIGFVVMKELAGMINYRLREAKDLHLPRIMGVL